MFILQKRELWLLLFVLLLVACGSDEAADVVVEEGVTAVSIPTFTPVPQITITPSPIPPSPTPTPPLAATVNDAPIFLADYEQELARYQQARVALDLPADEAASQIVLDALIEQELILQAAAAQGIVVPETAVDARLAELRIAGDDFAAWLAANQWESEDALRDALADEMVVGLMADAITADVPYVTPQAHARIIQLIDAAAASTIQAELAAGSTFPLMAQFYSIDEATAANGGDIGFFAQGSLLVPEVDAAAFGLEPNSYSDLITATAADGTQTFYLVQLIELDEQRPLTATMRYTLLQVKFDEWLAMQWEQTAVERFVNE